MADPRLTASTLMATGDPRTSSRVELLASELQGPGVVFCPNPKMPLWSNHPRVFIDVATTGMGKCAYCGTEYALKAGESVRAGH